jgi:hypothetical protein
MYRTTIGLLGLIALLLIAGCSSKDASAPSASGTTEPSLNLNSVTGGYTATNEEPAFGDPVLQAAGAVEASYNDPLLSTPAVDSIVKDTTFGWYHLRSLWGHLKFDSTETDITDWSGSLAISRGALILRRTIRFESGDYILPRTDRKKIEWVSFTTTHNDGIAVDIFVPRPRPILDTTIDTATQYDSVLVVDSVGDSSFTVDTVEVPVISVDTTWPVDTTTLTFTTPGYSRSFKLAEVMKLDTVLTLADSNEVAFWGMRFYRQACPRGFMAGGWGVPDSTGMGYFKGNWISRFAELSGAYEGHYGVDTLGDSVFFGKWIDSAGEFQGFFSGRYGYSRHHWRDSSLVTRGWYAGRIYDADNNPIGVLAGKFIGATSEVSGFMEGRWKLLCNFEEGDHRGNHGSGRGCDDDGMNTDDR